MDKVLSFEPRVGKVQMGQTTCEFTVICTNKKLKHNFYFYFIERQHNLFIYKFPNI